MAGIICCCCRKKGEDDATDAAAGDAEETKKDEGREKREEGDLGLDRIDEESGDEGIAAPEGEKEFPAPLLPMDSIGPEALYVPLMG